MITIKEIKMKLKTIKNLPRTETKINNKKVKS